MMTTTVLPQNSNLTDFRDTLQSWIERLSRRSIIIRSVRVGFALARFIDTLSRKSEAAAKEVGAIVVNCEATCPQQAECWGKNLPDIIRVRDLLLEVDDLLCETPGAFLLRKRFLPIAQMWEDLVDEFLLRSDPAVFAKYQQARDNVLSPEDLADIRSALAASRESEIIGTTPWEKVRGDLGLPQ